MNLLGTLPIGLSQLVSIGTSGVLSGQGRTPSDGAAEPSSEPSLDLPTGQGRTFVTTLLSFGFELPTSIGGTALLVYVAKLRGKEGLLAATSEPSRPFSEPSRKLPAGGAASDHVGGRRLLARRGGCRRAHYPLRRLEALRGRRKGAAGGRQPARRGRRGGGRRRRERRRGGGGRDTRRRRSRGAGPGLEMKGEGRWGAPRGSDFRGDILGAGCRV